MEIESIGSPCKETNEKEQPSLGAQLSQQADGILEWCGSLPDEDALTIIVGDLNPLSPPEQVSELLFGSGEGALDNRFGGLEVSSRI